MPKVSKEKIHEIDLSLLDEPRGSIRIEIDDERVSELAQSISETGLQQPVVVRPVGDRYEIVFGHRRFLAHKKIELPVISAIIRKMSDQQAAVSRATENLSRVDLTPIEEAATYKDLMDVHGMTVDQIAAKVGKSPAVVMRRMDLLKMPPALQQALHQGKISMSVAEELWPITDVSVLEYYLSFAVDGGCTKEVARSWCKEWRDTQRRSLSPGVEGGGGSSPYEPRPHYISCDICQGPVELGKDTVFRACPKCAELIRGI